MSKTLLELIKYFNRKERYLVVSSLLPPERTISAAFLERINSCLPDVKIVPADYWCIDYHLDWLYAALTLDGNAHASGNPIDIDRAECFKGTQEDIDLLVVAERQEETHLVLIEAKATTGWSNEQLQSKASRLCAIFGESGKERKGVCPHFVLMSPREPKQLATVGWPSWTKPVHWIELPTEEETYGQLTRCDEDGHGCVEGKHWKVLSRSYRPRTGE